MNLNKNTAIVLLSLLNGFTKSADIKNELPNVDIRTVQRGLSRLVELELISQSGPINDPEYSVVYEKLLKFYIDEKHLINEDRQDTHFNYRLLDWLESSSEDTIDNAIEPFYLAESSEITQRELEHLTIELSWKSSALEGNTYSLLDTELLLKEGVRPNNRTDFETQMILNHKDAINFIIENKEEFNNEISFSAVEELHKKIAFGLGIETGVRKRVIGITASNYSPPENPHQIREYAERILSIINKQKNYFVKATLAISLLPYLQVFEDGNKRTGRLLANAILISTVGKGFSLRGVDARDLALAYLAFYEFNSIVELTDILKKQLA